MTIPQHNMDARPWNVLNPIRDLAENWSVDVAKELEEYLEELEMVSMESDVRFAEAAMMVHGSAVIYSKKVEHLYSMVYRALDLITIRNSDSERVGRRRHRCDDELEDGQDEGGHAGLRSGAPVNAASAAVRGMLTMKAYRNYLKDEEDFCFLDESVPTAKLANINLDVSEEDGGEETVWVQGTLERKGPRAISIATPATPSMASAGRRRFVEENGTGGSRWPEITNTGHHLDRWVCTGDAACLWLRWAQVDIQTGALLLDVVPAVAESELCQVAGMSFQDGESMTNEEQNSWNPVQQLFTADMGDQEPLGDAETLTAQRVDWGADDPMSKLLQKENENAARQRYKQKIARKRKAALKHVHGDEDPWKELDAFPSPRGAQPGAHGNRPYRRGKTFVHSSPLRHPVEDSVSSSTFWVMLCRNAASWEPTEDRSEKPQELKKTFLDSAVRRILREPILPELDVSFAQVSDARRAARMRALCAESDQSEDESEPDDSDALDCTIPAVSLNGVPHLSMEDRVQIDTTSHPHEVRSLYQSDEPDDHGFFAGSFEPVHQASSDQTRDAATTYQALCRSYMEETNRAWRRLVLEKDLVQRVNEWHTTLECKLKAEEKRPGFDIRTYANIVRQALEKTTSAQQHVSLGAICAAPCRTEVCRRFLATLQLAAEGTLVVTRRESPQPSVFLADGPISPS